MKKTSTAVHVAKVQSTQNGITYTNWYLRQTYREDGKVKHRTLGSLAGFPQHAIDAVRESFRAQNAGEATPAARAPEFKILRTLPHGHVAAVLGTMSSLGLPKLLKGLPDRQRRLVLALIAARILFPASKLKTVNGLRDATMASSLGEVLDVTDASVDELYAAMDCIVGLQPSIEKALANKHLKDGATVLYDLSSSYMEGAKCPLAKFGYSRDGKKGKLQIEYGLLTDADGRPVAVEVFEGNISDCKTVARQVEKLRKDFKLGKLVLVGDRGMVTQTVIDDVLRKDGKLDWVSALRSQQIAELRQAGSLQMSLFDVFDLGEITDPKYPGERLVACRNPSLALRRAHKREALLAATEAQLDKVAVAVRRAKNPLRGSAKIGLRVGRLLNKHKMAKHFELTITDSIFSYVRNEVAIEAEQALDGIYVVRTSVPADKLDRDAVVQTYKRLTDVERAFRSLKTVDLMVRPIFHRSAPRVKAHVFLCMLAYYVEWHMRQALRPLLFDDEAPEAAEAARESPVAKAKVSKAAQRKAATLTGTDGNPVQSFRSLLADLGAVARVRVAIGGTRLVVNRYPVLTAVQAKALQLLGVKLEL